MPAVCDTGTRIEQLEPVIEAQRHVAEGKASDMSSGQLERKRHPVETVADVADESGVGLGHPESRPGRRRSRPEQPNGFAGGDALPRLV